MSDPPSSKRPRASSSSSTQSATVNYHPEFLRTSDCDVVLVSAGRTYFATQQLYLRASSAVFRDTLLVGSASMESNRIDGLPTIALTETQGCIQRFLAFIQTSPLVIPSPMTHITVLDELLTACDKYDAPLVGRSAVVTFFPKLGDKNIMSALAVALIHSRYETRPFLERAIRSMGRFSFADKGVDDPCDYYGNDGGKQGHAETFALGQRIVSVADIPSALLRRMAVEDIVEISRVQMKVIQETKYDYKQAAKDFKVHGYPNPSA